MPTPKSFPANVLDLFALLKTKKSWIVTSTVVCTGLGFMAAVMHRPTWQASQAMLIRDAAIASISVPGRFSDADSRKAAQETVVELAHSPTVVLAALERVGAPSRWSGSDWPSTRDVEATSALIDLRAPQGAEFGSTEMFYLLVQQSNKERAVHLTRCLGEELERHLQELRTRKAHGTVDELGRSFRLATDELKQATQELSEFEVSVGQDVVELKALTSTGSTDSSLQRNLNEVKNELRRAHQQHDTNRHLLNLLKSMVSEPEKILGTPNELLESQPGLRRLKDGLVDAQLLSSRLSGELSDVHPRVISARSAEKEIRRELAREVASAVNGLTAALDLTGNRAQSLESQCSQIEQRLKKIVPLRAEYKNRLDEVERRNQVLQSAEKNFSEAKADQAAAQTASLMTRWGEPITGSSPIGVGRTSLVMVGLFGGIVLGVGIVVLCFGGSIETGESVRSAVSDPGLDLSSAHRTNANRPSANLSQAWLDHPRVSTLRGAISHALSRAGVGD